MRSGSWDGMGHVTWFGIHSLAENSGKWSLFVCGTDMTVLPFSTNKTVDKIKPNLWKMLYDHQVIFTIPRCWNLF